MVKYNTGYNTNFNTIFWMLYIHLHCKNIMAIKNMINVFIFIYYSVIAILCKYYSRTETRDKITT